MFNKRRGALNAGWIWTLWRFQIIYFERKRIHFLVTRGYMPSRGFFIALRHKVWEPKAWQPKPWRFPYLWFRKS